MSTPLARICGPLAGIFLAAVVLVTVACEQPVTQWATSVGPAESAPGTSPSSAPASPPRQAPSSPECDRRASLRPQGPLPVPGRMPVDSTMARIAQRGYLIAGIAQDTYQFAFRDANLRPQGFDVDVVMDIAEAIFGDRERVVFQYVTPAGRIKAVNAGNADLVVATMTITCQRRREVEFSSVYFETGQRVLVNRGSGFRDLADLKGRQVCAARGSTSIETLKVATPKLSPVEANGTPICLALLQLGQVDAVSTDDALLAGMAAQDPQTEIVGPPLTEEPYGVAINKGTPDLVRFVNAVLERRVLDGRWRASYLRWLTMLGPPPPPPRAQYRD